MAAMSPVISSPYLKDILGICCHFLWKWETNSNSTQLPLHQKWGDEGEREKARNETAHLATGAQELLPEFRNFFQVINMSNLVLTSFFCVGNSSSSTIQELVNSKRDFAII